MERCFGPFRSENLKQIGKVNRGGSRRRDCVPSLGLPQGHGRQRRRKRCLLLESRAPYGLAGHAAVSQEDHEFDAISAWMNDRPPEVSTR